MIANEFVKTMARYNQWQNESVYKAGDHLGEEARKLDRGAFFGSIHRIFAIYCGGICCGPAGLPILKNLQF